MTFATSTINSATPAKDLMAALGPTLTAGGLTFVETYGTPVAASWVSTCFGAGVFVAVANGTATAATSPDGINWTQRSLPAVAAWQAVTFGGGMFVAIAQNSAIAASSPDGITWTIRATPVSTTWQAITYGGGQFVAIAYSTTIAATSPDGITWTQRVLPSNQVWYAVAYGAGVFVAVGQVTAGGAATSPDGITWTPRNLTSTTATAVCWGSSQFAAVCSNGAAMSSPDGQTWTTRTIPAGTYTSVAYSGSLFMAVASGGTVNATSPDGQTWTGKTALPASATWFSVAYGAGVFATVAAANTIAATTPDGGTTWTQRTLTATSANPVADVWKSPAASNQFGQDWYLILSRIGDFGATLYYQVAEQYNAATHRATNYGGTAVSVAPVAATFANPAAAVAPELARPGSASLTLTAATPFTYWASANGNRLVVGVKTNSEQGFYAGLFDDLLPAGVTQFPLVCAYIAVPQTSGYAIGGGTGFGMGGFSREPGQAAASTSNFEARVHNGWQVGLAAVVPGGYTPNTSSTPGYGNPFSTSRVMIGTARATTALADGLRGLLIGCVTSSALTVIGDRITADGKTYVRIAGPASNYGIFADQGA